MQRYTQKLPAILVLAFIATAFFLFGLYHLTKFETTDEHFWKYDRIEKYWNGWNDTLQEHDLSKLKKTRINDKPGVTVALLSGIGLLFEPDPDTHEIIDPNIIDTTLLRKYDTSRTESINLSQRLPILIFNTLFLFVLFWLFQKLLSNKSLSLFATAATAFMPATLGMSQMTNPDSLLWNFSAAALLSYILLLTQHKKRYLFLTLLFTGFSLLSKYTGNLLFLLYIILFLSYLFVSLPKIRSLMTVRTYIVRSILHWMIILIGSAALYAIFIPAVFLKPVHLYAGTIGSPAFAPLLVPIFSFLVILGIDACFFKSALVGRIASLFHAQRQVLYRIVSAVMLFFFLFVLIGPHVEPPLLPLNNVRENSFEGGELIMPMFSHDTPVLRIIEGIALEMQAFIFSLPLFILTVIMLLWIKILFFGAQKHAFLIFFLTVFPLIYFAGLLFAGVLGNPRYSIMLYTPTALLMVLGISEFVHSLSQRFTYLQTNSRQTMLLGIIFLLFTFSAIYSLLSIRPHYLNYTNILLPQKFSVMDGWGYGSYEAAEYLNALPHAQDLVIWSDRDTVCQFFVGSCIKNHKIDLEKIVPDYVVISRRNAIRHRFIWGNGYRAQEQHGYYYTTEPDWQIDIGGRSENYVKVVKILP